MLDKPIDQVCKADIDALIEDEVREARVIDFKGERLGKSDEQKREFLGDASSFANAAGGHLVFGVEEQDGVAVAAPGITIEVDAEILRVEAMIRDGIGPRIPGVQTQAIDGFPNGHVLLIRIPKSWSSPHMITLKNSSRFFTRNSAGKYQMDVTEIRSAFALSEALPERIRRFRDERIARIIAGETPVPLSPDAKAILHVLPLSSFSLDSQIDPAAIYAQRGFLTPLSGGGNGRYNIDGYITIDPPGDRDPAALGYCQAYRTGAVEAVDSRLLRVRGDGKKLIPGPAFEERFIDSTGSYLAALRELRVPTPIVVMATLSGVKGFELGVTQIMWDVKPIDRDHLLLPDVLVETYDCEVAQLLRPVFDALWNAGGHERCLSYGEDGVWRRQ